MTSSKSAARNSRYPLGNTDALKTFILVECPFTEPHHTVREGDTLHPSNRTYLSAYIKTTYKMTFREWITGLRLEYAKNILKEHPEINIQKLAESSGFLSRSNFIKAFTEKEGCTPGKWKKANLE